ncbi:MAG: ribonuclease D, partial [Rhodospirillales bacterium]|nr:ribonuclease D [Rhodospirillales bacterium]
GSMGLAVAGDRVCLGQVSARDDTATLARFGRGTYEAPRLKAMLEDRDTLKLYHFARADMATLEFHLGVRSYPNYCTKIASRFARTYTDRHGLKDLCKELLGIDISKQQQQTDWGGETLTVQQQRYAATDVLHLHRLRGVLDGMLTREGRQELARQCFEFLPARVRLDLMGWADADPFSHDMYPNRP